MICQNSLDQDFIIRTLPSGFVVKRQKIDAVAWEVFILPFHPKLWLFLILLCGCTSLVLYIMHRYPKASYLNFFSSVNFIMLFSVHFTIIFK